MIWEKYNWWNDKDNLQFNERFQEELTRKADHLLSTLECQPLERCFLEKNEYNLNQIQILRLFLEISYIDWYSGIKTKVTVEV